MGWPTILEKIVDNENAIDGVNSEEKYSGEVVFGKEDKEDGEEGTTN